MLFWLDFHHAQSNPYMMIQWWYNNSDCSGTDWSSMSPSHLSLSPCTGSRLQLASSSRHWCLHIEQPRAMYPPTSTPLWQSTSPQEVWDLRASNASWYHQRESQNRFPELFRPPILTGGINFPPLSGMLITWPENSSLSTQLASSKKQQLCFLFP